MQWPNRITGCGVFLLKVINNRYTVIVTPLECCIYNAACIVKHEHHMHAVNFYAPMGVR